ncbi:hypothetical protein ABT354_19520 [Streptomyces sp. NPDC000594]|uniref:hypothetical protein n=1 Tax=Streptomyces sp. NPDC000594 TaxID=3154261 RepID=UPI00331B0AB0
MAPRALVYANDAEGSGRSLRRLPGLTREAAHRGYHVLAAVADISGKPVRERKGIRALERFLPHADLLLVNAPSDLGASAERGKFRRWLDQRDVTVAALHPEPGTAQSVLRHHGGLTGAAPPTVPCRPGTVDRRLVHAAVPAELGHIPALTRCVRDLLTWAFLRDRTGGLVLALHELATHCITYTDTPACLRVTLEHRPGEVLVRLRGPATVPLPVAPLTLVNRHATAWGSTTRPGQGRNTWMRIPVHADPDGASPPLHPTAAGRGGHRNGSTS